MGVTGNSIIGLMAQPSLEMVIGIWGILYAGGAYLPLDPEYPVERLNFMLNDSHVALILTDCHAKDRFFEREALNNTTGTNKIKLMDISTLTANQKTREWGEFSFDNRFDYLAYIIYTSGSTGRPKGLAV